MSSVIVTLVTALIVAGCQQPDQKSGTADRNSKAGADSQKEELPYTPFSERSKQPEGLAYSLFAGTDYAKKLPQTISFSLDGSFVAMREAGTEANMSSVKGYPIDGNKLGEATLSVQSPNLMRAYITAHPTEARCMLISQRQLDTGNIVDVIWEYSGGGPYEVPFLQSEGLPADLPAQALYNLAPIYSWDGASYIVPLNAGGLCIIDPEMGKGQYYPYPDFQYPATGQACRALPDINGESFAFFSRWQAGGAEEHCQVCLFNITKGEWVAKTELTWPVYEIAVLEEEGQPWLVRGSRPPQKNIEHERVPRIARVDPTTGTVDLLEFNGQPYWPVVLEPHGRWVVYIDDQRQSITRICPRTGRLEYDPRFCQDEALLYVCTGGDPVYAWYRGDLIKAEFNKSEQFEGYASAE